MESVFLLFMGHLQSRYFNQNIVLRDRQAGGYGFCKPEGDISSQGRLALQNLSFLAEILLKKVSTFRGRCR